MVEQFEGTQPGRGAPSRGSGLRWILTGAGVLVVAALVAVLLVFTGKDDSVVSAADSTSQEASATQADAPAGSAERDPGTVTLPGGGTAKLVYQELTGDGTLPIPQGLGEAAWWGEKLGAAHGAALFSGHVNWKGKRGPFDELWRLKAGQDVTVADAGGGRWVYRISDVVTVHKDQLAGQADKLFGPDGDPRLVLVTCGGDYVGGTEGYEDNRIVTASLVSHP
ncbi:class F sortase [Amycolatopsis sp. H20-H5]|uniref:class F sortase n=1 Tax=Amycolatopsis sp. H20-H5 TaxID=3046309 RepID=UPI002DB84EFA|nr:class F sortase [Amycolatopsis sp. H20-H5]MEC3977197.1 class F sortase [Amycolatopsis sp. H20-H5]